MEWIESQLFVWLGLFVVALLLLTGGCAPNAEVIERMSSTMITEVVRPAVEKATTELVTQGAILQGNVQGIAPGYSVEFEGFLVTGVKGVFEIRAVGVAGTLSGATQAIGQPDEALEAEPSVEAELPSEPL